ncbi:MAG TPA: acyltransferase [Pseudomonadota bacterium]|nr:acyltransferase [Pseudomonadota bacterium]
MSAPYLSADAALSPDRRSAGSPSGLRPPSFGRTLIGCGAALALSLNVIFCVGFLLVPVALLKLLTPAGSRPRLWCDRVLNAIGRFWIENNARWERATQSTRWDVQGVSELTPGGWYLVTCNHQSWVDVLVLQRVLNGRIPLLKFFLKRQLLYVPFMGLAWWALDFPFMQRHSKEYLDRHPEQRHRDLQTTQKSCERFSKVPTSVLNFLEGTRFTAAKHRSQGSPFVHLLRPKAAGLALAVQSLGDKFSSLLSVTIVYPDGIPTFWEFLCNRLPRVAVRVGSEQIPADLFGGDYQGDADYRQRFQAWVNGHWSAKDAQLAALHAELARV